MTCLQELLHDYVGLVKSDRNRGTSSQIFIEPNYKKCCRHIIHLPEATDKISSTRSEKTTSQTHKFINVPSDVFQGFLITNNLFMIIPLP
jgi:hypothetical protein